MKLKKLFSCKSWAIILCYMVLGLLKFQVAKAQASANHGDERKCYGEKVHLGSAFNYTIKGYSKGEVMAVGLTFRSNDTSELKMLIQPWCVDDVGNLNMQIKTEHFKMKASHPLAKVDWDSRRESGNHGDVMIEALKRISNLNSFVVVGKGSSDFDDVEKSFYGLFGVVMDSIAALVPPDDFASTPFQKTPQVSSPLFPQNRLCAKPTPDSIMTQLFARQSFCHGPGEIWLDTIQIEVPAKGLKIEMRKHVGIDTESGLIIVEVRGKFFPEDEFAEGGNSSVPEMDFRMRSSGKEEYDPVMGVMVHSEMEEVWDGIASVMNTSMSLHAETRTFMDFEMGPRKLTKDGK